MKKNFGFTLAEVLITLGIIGVVAALAAPALNGAVQKSKLGPNLRKFISTMQTANENILFENDADVISSVIENTDTYLNSLKKQVKGTIGDAKPLKDIVFSYYGIQGSNSANFVIFTFPNGDAAAFSELSAASGSRDIDGGYKGRVATIFYDINGFDAKPNRLGKDIFQFLMDDSGSITPKGGRSEYNAYSSATVEKTWESDNGKLCSSVKVSDGATCAGSIADNDWKVIYKY